MYVSQAKQSFLPIEFMKISNLFHILLVSLLIPFALSCNDEETYADKREREDKQINAFLQSGAQVRDNKNGIYLLNVPGGINVIDEKQFAAQGHTTDVEHNQYVKFDNGVYMQIVNDGTGEKLAEGETEEILIRYTEYNIATASIQSTNKLSTSEMTPDVMSCTNTLGVFSATFTQGTMYATYKSAAVPAGWLIPLTYVKIGRLNSSEATLAAVRLIVPGSQGHAEASSNVYPCFYEISYQRSR